MDTQTEKTVKVIAARRTRKVGRGSETIRTVIGMVKDDETGTKLVAHLNSKATEGQTYAVEPLSIFEEITDLPAYKDEQTKAAVAEKIANFTAEELAALANLLKEKKAAEKKEAKAETSTPATETPATNPAPEATTAPATEEAFTA
jgi:hypothetical protein